MDKTKIKSNTTKYHFVFLEDLFPLLATTSVISFVFFFYEPIVLFATNPTDFWFDYKVLFSACIQQSLIIFIILTIASLLFYLICKKIRKMDLFYITNILIMIILIYLYIHGNFLAGGLPVLNGEEIDWDNNLWNAISIILMVATIALTVFALRKLNNRNCYKYGGFMMCAICIMATVSALSVILPSKSFFTEKEVQAIFTKKDMDVLSSKNNFIVVLFDATDSIEFNKVVEDRYAEKFKDFTYYNNAAAGYAQTRDSIPLIFTGKWNLNEEPYASFSSKAFSDSPLLKTLWDNNYKVNFYSQEVMWNNSDVLKLNNTVADSVSEWNGWQFAKQIIKYDAFKYLPYPLKRFSKIENLNFTLAQKTTKSDTEIFNWSNLGYYNDITADESYTLTDQPIFQYIHLEGAHNPYTYDENLNEADNATYSSEVAATVKIADAVIERLKKAGVYDNTTLVFMADHSWTTKEVPSTINPILYIKNTDDHNEKTNVCSRQISWEDLAGIFSDLTNGVSQEKAVEDIPWSGRIRRQIFEDYMAEDHMVEYLLNGDTWDNSALYVSGVTYDL